MKSHRKLTSTYKVNLNLSTFVVINQININRINVKEVQ